MLELLFGAGFVEGVDPVTIEVRVPQSTVVPTRPFAKGQSFAQDTRDVVLHGPPDSLARNYSLRAFERATPCFVTGVDEDGILGLKARHAAPTLTEFVER